MDMYCLKILLVSYQNLLKLHNNHDMLLKFWPQQFLGLELVGSQHSATLLHSHDTGSCATMNMALGGDVIAAGQDGNCRVMRFRQQGPKEGRSAALKDGW